MLGCLSPSVRDSHKAAEVVPPSMMLSSGRELWKWLSIRVTDGFTINLRYFRTSFFIGAWRYASHISTDTAHSPLLMDDITIFAISIWMWGRPYACWGSIPSLSSSLLSAACRPPFQLLVLNSMGVLFRGGWLPSATFLTFLLTDSHLAGPSSAKKNLLG